MDYLRYRIGYDLRTKITEIKNTIVGTNLISADGPNLTSVQKRLSVKVPIETLDEFLEYETVLKNDENEIEALVVYI